MKEFKIKRNGVELIVQKYWFSLNFKNSILKFGMSDAMWIKTDYYGNYFFISTECEIRINNCCGEVRIMFASSEILLKITKKEMKNLFQFLEENSMR